jgi:hypothetical protein
MIVLIYNFIFPVRLAVFPQSAFLLYTFLLVYGSFNRNLFKIFTKITLFLPTLFMSSILLLLAIISIMFNQSNDFLGIVVIVKFIFALIASAIIIQFVLNYFPNNSLSVLIKIMVISSLVIAIACIMEFFNPNVKLILSQIIYDPPGHTNYVESFRSKGFASSGGSSLSVGLAMSAILSIFLIKQSKGFYAFLWLITTFIISCSTLFVGRTGTFLLLGFLLLQSVNILSIKKIITSIFMVSALYYSSSFLNDTQTNIVYSYSLEPIKNYIEMGTFSSNSTTALKSMFYMPDLEHLLWGAGYWRYPTHNYQLSDVGYLKVLFAFGIFGFIVFYSYQIFIYYSAYKYYVRIKNFKFGFLFLFSFPFIIEFKEEYFLQNYAFKMLILLIMFAFLNKKQSYFKQV